MKHAADFRRIARNALHGKWLVAILTGFVSSLIGAGITSGGGGRSSNSSDSTGVVIRDFQVNELWPQLWTFLIIAVVILAILAIVMIVISGAGKLGYAIFNLKLVDNKDPAFSDLFSQFDRLGAGFCMNFLKSLFIFLWSLLFVIPGIIKSYSYAMTQYILAEHPEMTAMEAITESRHIMDENKWRLFCLDFSFIGWRLLRVIPTLIALAFISRSATVSGNLAVFLCMILCSIPSFIGSLFLMPYQEAAYAAFYRDVSETTLETQNPTPQDDVDRWMEG